MYWLIKTYIQKEEWLSDNYLDKPITVWKVDFGIRVSSGRYELSILAIYVVNSQLYLHKFLVSFGLPQIGIQMQLLMDKFKNNTISMKRNKEVHKIIENKYGLTNSLSCMG